MPKLLQINATANWGSTGKIAEQIGLCAMAHGWASYIAYGRYCNHSKSYLLKVGTKLDTYFHYGEQRIRDNEGLCSRGATRKLIDRINDIQPDIIHLHNIHDHYINYRILFGYLNQTNIKVVWTFHDCWAFTGHCMHFVTENCERWKEKCHDCPMKGQYPKTVIDRSESNYLLKKELFTSCKNLTIVPASYWLGNFVSDSFLKDKRIQVIHNGIDLNVFNIISPKSSNKFRILGVSSVWPKAKGIYDIFELRKMLPPEEYEIMMVGLSKNQIEELPDGIIGIERTQNVQDLVKLYNEANVLINPTYADTFPTVNLEALACGTPVITYNTGGSPEAIDEKTGIVVEQGDIVGLANSIMYVRDNNFSSDICRKRAEQYFDKDKNFEKYIALYNELLKNG